MKESDPIVWVPASHPYYAVLPIHNCPMAVVVARVTRGMLDPMALGVCRYCKEELP